MIPLTRASCGLYWFQSVYIEAEKGTPKNEHGKDTLSRPNGMSVDEYRDI